jgi:hypothetical protein
MSQSPDNDWLERILQQKAPPFADAGFTADVLSRLPAPPSAAPPSRLWIVLVFAALADMICCFFLPAGTFLWQAMGEVVFFWQQSSFPWTSLAVVLLLLLGTIAFATAENGSN